MSAPPERAGRRLELSLAPEWDTVKDTWDTCLAHLAAQGLDEDTAFSLGMVAQELLENAVKYGDFSPGRDRIHFAISGRADALVIEVRTPLGNPAALERLDGMIQWIRGFQNPFEAFVERLKEIAARPYANPESGLGLVRVAYEGQCLLDFYVDDADVLAMSAVFQRRPSRVPGRGHDAA